MSGRPDLLHDVTGPPLPRQARSARRREDLKTAALALFAKHGYERTSVTDIATRARLPVGTFYQHFSSKRHLLLVLMDDLLQTLSELSLAPVLRGGDARGAIRQLLSAAFSGDLAYLGAYRAWQEAILSDADLTREHGKILAWTTGRIEGVFKQLQRWPGARPRAPIAALARAMDRFFWSLLTDAIHSPRVEMHEWIEASSHLIFHGLFVDQRSKGRRR
jgi:AcrR family transcriptional regulator